MRLRLAAAAALTLASTLSLAGCTLPGAGGDRGDPRDVAAVRAVFERFADAINAGDLTAACALYTPRAQQLIVVAGNRLGPATGECPVAFGRIAARLPEQRHQLRDVVIDGDRATAVNENSRSDREVVFRRVAGAWRVDNATG